MKEQLLGQIHSVSDYLSINDHVAKVEVVG